MAMIDSQSLYMAITGDDDTINMANNLRGFDHTDACQEETRRGGTALLKDGQLWTRRYELVFLFEGTWPDIGGKVAKIKTSADVYDMLKVWLEQDRQNHSRGQSLAEVVSRPSHSQPIERKTTAGERVARSLY